MLKRFHHTLIRTCQYGAIVGLLASYTALSAPCGAADEVTPNNASAVAVSRVADALKAEAQGDLLTRQRLLIEAEYASDYPPAKWHRGKLEDDNGDWCAISASIEKAQQDMLLDDYELRRANSRDNLASHFVTASWCYEQGLFDQCRAHLNRVLAFDPDNMLARRALGCVAIGREWIAPEEIAVTISRAEEAMKSVKKYGQRLQAWLGHINSTHRDLSHQAVHNMLQMQEVDAVPAVEAIFASPAVRISEIAVNWLGTVDCIESSKALSRYALFHPDNSIRQTAVTKLAERPLHDFVPDLLALLTSPISSMLVPVLDRNGALVGYRQAFSQEKFDQKEFLIIDRGFQRSSPRLPAAADRTTGAGSRAFVDALNRRIEQSLYEFALGEANSRKVEMQRTNEQVQQRNARIASVLSQVAEREFYSDAEEMWDWWDRYNETEYQRYKPERYQRSTIVDSVPTFGQQSGECFVAGTPVVTQRGIKPIERVVVGDRVLSRDVRSGELAWKPVLRSTTRPPEATVSISVGEEVFCCTGGHLFWVSGTGWSKASQIEPGSILHAAEEPVVVTRAKHSGVLPTFNLEVADHHVYFVGRNMVMTHDVTPRRHTRQKVPGQELLSLAE